MIIPIEELEPSTLCNIVEGFVLREGTEYGEIDCSLEDKVKQVVNQLKKGEVLLVYSELHESVNIVPKEQFNAAESEY
ncbi:YheU family protein [Paraglaciecola aquimarina]|uniref:YheU family protein n=1 Tax=Paraglaciecola aquimarina TaxID=1235557 RepID=A0ABU3STA8_9ALTE|nr:YheU family protein [Paraglaciecola aquimarina]MDU0353235.1 YheU family protein [Paraglaciecola aquimarina]